MAKSREVKAVLKYNGLVFLAVIYFIIFNGARTVCLGDEAADLEARGTAAYLKGEYDTAMVFYNKMVQLNAPSAYYYRGVNYYAMHEYGKAIVDLNDAIRLFRRRKFFSVNSLSI